MSSKAEAVKRTTGGGLSRLADRHFAALALGPIIGLLAAAAVIPFAISLYLSFTDFSFNLPDHNGAFVGLSNYRLILADDRFHASLRTQLLFLFCTIPCEFFLGLWIAVSLRRVGEIRNRLLPLLVVPMLLAPVTAGMIWRLLLHGDYGPIGYYLTRLPPLQGSSILREPNTSVLRNRYRGYLAVDAIFYSCNSRRTLESSGSTFPRSCGGRRQQLKNVLDLNCAAVASDSNGCPSCTVHGFFQRIR